MKAYELGMVWDTKSKALTKTAHLTTTSTSLLLCQYVTDNNTVAQSRQISSSSSPRKIYGAGMGILAAGFSPTMIAAAPSAQSLSSSNRKRINFVVVKVKATVENDPLLQAAIDRASLRFQETHRPGD